jgi:2-oxoglutarate dehydrogenase E2 component (dihydrolipoamide succinyltransferase)
VLSTILKDNGSIVTSGELLATITAQIQQEPTQIAKPVTNVNSETISLSPSVRRLVHENSLDPALIPGSGKDGRLTKSDVLTHLSTQQEIPRKELEIATKTDLEQPAKPDKANTDLLISNGHRPEQRVPMTRLRAKIAERLLQAQQNAAMLTTFNEVNMQNIIELRNQYKARFEQKHNTKLGFMSFFVKASIEALKRFPAINASIDNTDIIYHGYYDIGIAISTPRGLIVPVLRDADQLDFAGIELGIVNFGEKARSGILSFDDLKGGTFTITNGGIFGSMLSTPILNPPQCAILGMHAIKERPVVENGQIVIRPIMYLALSYDHRLVDGREAVQFLVTIKECLEAPAHLLLNI